MLVVWAYNLENIIPTCRDFDDKLIKLVWNQRSAFLTSASPSSSSNTSSDANLTEKQSPLVDEKEVEAIARQKEQSSKRDKDKKKKKRGCSFGLSYFVSNKEDIEKAADGPSLRPTRLLAPIYCGLAAALSFCRWFCHWHQSLHM